MQNNGNDAYFNKELILGLLALVLWPALVPAVRFTCYAVIQFSGNR